MNLNTNISWIKFWEGGRRRCMQYGNLSPKYIFISVNYKHFSALFNNLLRKSKSLLSFLLLFVATSPVPHCSEIVQKGERRPKFGVWLSSIMALLISWWHFLQIFKSLLVWALFWGQYSAIEGCLVLLHSKSLTLPILFIVKGDFFFFHAAIPWEGNTWGGPQKYIKNEF